MNNTFLLKDKSGCVSGYLMQYGTGIKYRSNCSMEDKAELILLFENGMSETKVLSGTGEMVWKDLSDKIEGALVISSENIILLSTGKAACKRWQEEQTKLYSKRFCSNKTEIQKQKIETDVQRAVASSSHAPEIQYTGKHIWPERRWPSPPCMKDGEYRGGKWRSGE